MTRPLLVALALAACAAPPGQESPKQDPPTPAPERAPAKPSPGAPTFLLAPDGEVAEIVRKQAASGGPLVVYVGATWCEPCVAFHEATTAGRFDRELAGVRFLEFDADRDRERLTAAGYASRLIPLFALPGPDGRASERRIEGGIKGPGAAEHVLRRLVPLVDPARASTSP